MNDRVYVPIVTLGRVAAATVLTRWRGQLRLTVVAKATFAFAPQGEMALAPPVKIVTGDAFHGNSPMRSVRVASDLAPHLERAEIFFSGHAHAVGGPTTQMQVRVAISNDRGVLVDKRLDVLGDRKGGPHASPLPFEKMPIVYERAFGGVGSTENPLGMGVTRGSDGPNLMYPDELRAKDPACFGPIGAMWPPRKKLLRGYPRKALDQPIAELPDDFAWDFFQAAPQDQQLPGLAGREWLVLEGVSARHPMLHMRLPAARAAAMLYAPGWAKRPFELMADTVFVDGDAELCTLTYRASVPLASEAVLGELCVAAGLDLPGQPIAWPAELDAAELRMAAPRATPGGAVNASGTLAIDANDLRGTMILADDVPPPEKALPFQTDPGLSRREKVDRGIPGAPWEEKVAPAVKQASPFDRTLTIDGDDPDVEILPAAPVPAPAAAPPPPSAAARPPSKANPWAPSPEAPKPAPMPRPAAPVVAPPPGHKQSLYRKFDKG